MGNLNLKEELEKKNEEFKNSDHIFGMTLLTSPQYINSSRSLMVTSQLRQFVNLIEPELPKVFTNYENVVGKYSTGYYRAKQEMEVYAKIPKFENGKDDNHLYLMFLYDRKHDKYEVITKKIVEDLTEKFGYAYVNDVMDSKEEGDVVEEGEVLYTTTSYDEDMNYRYGKNAKVMYVIDNRTIEDAIVCSESFANSMVSKEVETVRVSLNENDILCNIYGDNDEYKAFPDIGELIRDKIVCCKRRIHNSQILFDLKKSNLRKMNINSDRIFFNEGRLVDIFIYSNKPLDEIEDNVFNGQLKKYLKMQTEFYTKVHEVCGEIINSGSKFSPDISYYYKRSEEIIDSDVKWREESGSVFSNMVVEFLIERNSPLLIGQKITGRVGNKGVVSSILPDDEMPYTENGDKVDVLLNALGVINRLNSLQIFESSINFITNTMVRRKLAEMDKLKDKEKLLFDIVKRFNEVQADDMLQYHKGLTPKNKKEFFNDIQKDGIFIHLKPMSHENEPYLFDVLDNIYKDYDWIKPVDVYVNKFGRKIKILKPMIIGDIYIMKLKQSSKKGFSARATGAISKRGVPDKSYKTKEHQDLHSTTPIRIGDQENNNSVIGVDPTDIAKFHLFHRSSPIGRRNLGRDLATHIKPLKDYDYGPNVTNRNAEILEANLKAMGLRLVFPDDYLRVDPDDNGIDSLETEDGSLFIGTLDDYEDYKLEDKVRNDIKYRSGFIGNEEAYNQLLTSEVKRRKDKRDAPKKSKVKKKDCYMITGIMNESEE